MRCFLRVLLLLETLLFLLRLLLNPPLVPKVADLSTTCAAKLAFLFFDAASAIDSSVEIILEGYSFIILVCDTPFSS